MAHEQLHQAIRMLAGVDDYARTLDGSGFNKLDTFFGNQLAQQETLTDRQAVKAYRQFAKYKDQLARMGIDWDSIPVPREPEVSNTIDWQDGVYIVSFAFSYEIKNKVALIPGAYYNGDRTWRVPERSYHYLRAVADEYHFVWLTDMAIDLPQRPLRYVEVRGDQFLISFEKNYELNKEIKKILGRRWSPSDSAWTVPLTSALAIQQFIKKYGFECSEDVQSIVDEQEARIVQTIASSFAADADFSVDGLLMEPRPYQRAGAKFLVENKNCWLGDPTGLGKTGQTLMAIQATHSFPLIVCPKSAKTVWIREARKWFGLHYIQLSGRPTEAQRDAMRRLMTMKRETRPQMTGDDHLMLQSINESHLGPLSHNETVEMVQLRATVGENAALLDNPDGVVINYDILKYWIDILDGMGFTAIIGDESHRLKSGKAQRTRAFREVGRNCEYKWLLSATPIMNRLYEFWSQIQILGAEAHFGGYRYFTEYFCGSYYDGYGYNTSGFDDPALNAQRAKEFNDIARAKGDYIRREVEEVAAELPEVQRNMIYLDIDNRREYNRAVLDIVNYIGEQAERDREFLESIRHLSPEEQREAISAHRVDKEQAAQRAVFLVKINALRQLTSKGKMRSIIEWIDTFVENGEKLLVAGWYEDHIKELAAHYNKGYITGSVSQTKRDQIIDSFQTNDDDLLCFVNLRAGGESITLTGTKNNPCRHVAYFNFDWSPEVHTQVRGRIRRLGTTATNLFEYWLVGEDTIDIENVQMISDKELVTTAGKTGDAGLVPEVHLVQRLTDYFKSQAARINEKL